MPKRKEEIITIRTNIEFKQELTEKIQKGTQYDNVSDATRDLLGKFSRGELEPTVSIGINAESEERILNAISTSETNILSKLDSHFSPRNLSTANENEQIEKIVEQILADLDLSLAVKCKTELELAELFLFDFHKDFVYDVIKRLEQENQVSFRKNKLYWRIKEEKS
ncbi:MAG: hypothetical protein KAU62_09675 [Candidatus Heimdallarchaeota archaeon]|nr:hypothetical protein [Candidatus Heimdallarchaeota archaeon]MCK4611410.1 hypothetical protein [Candidatus Heimdallarchaeota archaeon]